MRAGVCLPHWRERFGPWLDSAIDASPAVQRLIAAGALELTTRVGWHTGTTQQQEDEEEELEEDGEKKKKKKKKGMLFESGEGECEGLEQGARVGCVGSKGYLRLAPTAKGMALGDWVQEQLCDAVEEMLT